MDCVIRLATTDDAAEISRVVLSALYKSNARDYGPETIARVARGFAPDGIAAMIATRRVFVAVDDDRILGTASLEGGVARAVFVEPDAQGSGIGRALMAEIERVATVEGIAVLTLQSSLTAVGFYGRLGFRMVREHHHERERTIVMERQLR